MTECLVCYDYKDEIVKCKCNAALCTDCFTEYSHDCYNSKGKLPKCVVCPREYLIDSFSDRDVALDYAKLLYEFLKRNPDFQSKMGTIVKEKQIIDRIRTRKTEIYNRLPAALKHVAQVALQDKYKKAMKINREYVRAQVEESSKRRKCFSGICRVGNMIQNEAGNWICDTCHGDFCGRCEKLRFENHICHKDDLDSINFVAGLLHCPSCNSPAQKISGCNFLTCPICGCKFNELTLQIEVYGGKDKKLDLKEKDYSLSAEIMGKYEDEIMDFVKEYEKQAPTPERYDVFTEFLENDEIEDDDTIFRLFEVYSEFRETQTEIKEYYDRLLELRRLHIDDNLTVENIRKLFS